MSTRFFSAPVLLGLALVFTDLPTLARFAGRSTTRVTSPLPFCPRGRARGQSQRAGAGVLGILGLLQWGWLSPGGESQSGPGKRRYRGAKGSRWRVGLRLGWRNIQRELLGGKSTDLQQNKQLAFIHQLIFYT